MHLLFHGDPRKQTDLSVAPGTKCQLIRPVSGDPLPRAHCPTSSLSGHLRSSHEKKSRGIRGSHDVWGHYHSRVLDNFELLSTFDA